jgi:soluble lytic murein transglycosylase-like protein
MGMEYKKLKITEQELGESYNMLMDLYVEVDEYIQQIDVITAYANAYQIPAEVVIAIMKIESNFNPDVIGRTNDYGLMQINEVNLKHLENKLEALNISTNVEIGTTILSGLYNESNELEYILNSYNMGKGGYMDYVQRTGEVSRAYSRKGIEYINILKGDS